MTMTQMVLMALIQIVVLLGFVMTLVPLITFAERKVIAYVQVRLGATRTAGGLWGAQAGRTHKSRTLTGGLNGLMWFLGRARVLSIFRGLPVFVADAVKLLTKEDIVPEGADKAVFILSPAISVIAAFTVFSAVAFAPGALFTFPAWFPVLGGLPFNAFLTDVNVGLLFILGVSSVGVYGIVLGAWASNSKYPLLGGLRSAAQIISYEVPLTLSLLVPVILTGSLNFNEMARKTAIEAHWLSIPLLFVGFFIYTTCAFAETNRVPFDLAEAETELVSGFHTEYTGMKFSFYFLAEYANMILVSTLASLLFLGGWLSPFPAAWGILGAPGIGWLLAKIAFFMFLFLWVRASFPRYRYDQIMRLGWKVFIPVTLVWIAVTGVMMLEPLRAIPPFSIWFGK